MPAGQPAMVGSEDDEDDVFSEAFDEDGLLDGPEPYVEDLPQFPTPLLLNLQRQAQSLIWPPINVALGPSLRDLRNISQCTIRALGAEQRTSSQ